MSVEIEFRDQLSRLVKGQIFQDEPLSRHTSFGIGGPADFFVQPETEEAMVAVLRLARSHGLSVMVIGRGTNLLVGDGGVRGVVLDLCLACHRLEQCAGGATVGSGVSVSELLDFCVRLGLGGLEFMVGIPGSVGGAIRVNAGAWDRSMGDLIREVRGYHISGQPRVLEAKRLDFRYREANLPQDLIVAEVDLTLTPTPERLIQMQMEEFGRRRRSQPTGQRSAGCVFKNPPGRSAGKLIEEAGCKGLKVSEAEVSCQHANFIVNKGGASAADVRQLIEMVHQRVYDQFGIELQKEIILVGEE